MKARVREPLLILFPLLGTRGKGGGVQWWVKRCKSSCVRTQVARMGADAETLECIGVDYIAVFSTDDN